MIGIDNVASSTTDAPTIPVDGREQDSDQDDGDGQPAAHLAEHADEIRHHQIGDARAIEHQAHVDEHRQRNEDPICHRCENTVDDDREIAPARQQECVDTEIIVKNDTAGREQQRQAAERPGDGIAEEQRRKE